MSQETTGLFTISNIFGLLIYAGQPKIIVVEKNSLSTGKYIDWMLLSMHVVDTQLDYEFISSSMTRCCDPPAITCSVSLNCLPYPLVLPHIIISDEVSGTGANEISFGTMLAFSLTQPRVCGDDKVVFA